jgi:hypothetical protein
MVVLHAIYRTLVLLEEGSYDFLCAQKSSATTRDFIEALVIWNLLMWFYCGFLVALEPENSYIVGELMWDGFNRVKEWLLRPFV